MSNNLKPIETRYKGCRFRSRLEARWAVFFDAMGVRWEYEKEGYHLSNGERYLPDFWLPELGVWIEVKGQRPTAAELERCRLLRDGTGNAVAIVHEQPGEHQAILYCFDLWGGGGSSSEWFSWIEIADQGGITFWPVERSPAGSGFETEGRVFYLDAGMRRALPEAAQVSRQKAIVEACNAAKAARFEHGETAA
jgi:hypothetical protein